MKYAIIGSGKIGAALARIFARENIEVAIANSRGPETLSSLTEELGPSAVPKSIQDAHKAEMIFLAVPFSAHKAVAQQFEQWNGKIVVDLTNAFHVAPEEIGGLLSSEVVSQAFVGARLVKAFNHLPAEQLGTNPSMEGQRQVVFVSSNDPEAGTTVAAVATHARLCSSRTRKARSGRRIPSCCGRAPWRPSISESGEARLIAAVT